MDQQIVISSLLEKYASGSITEGEQKELADRLQSVDEPIFIKLMEQYQLTVLQSGEYRQPDSGLYERIRKRIYELEAETRPPVKMVWWWAAASILLVITAAYLWFKPATQKEQVLVKQVPAGNDILPGGDKAILTLADGTTIVLDSAANGSLAQQGNMSIEKLADGQIVYRPVESNAGEVLMNTMSTPRGGQYQLTLPDGTKVWLNAASSITYPNVFVEGQRKVKIKGEVYLEVKKNTGKPFIVDVDGRSSIEVLGTIFNINSYPDEAGIKTTLIEGSVRVSGDGQKAVLNPGQQAISQGTGQPFRIVNHPDLEQVLAWKNGYFNFQDLSFPEVARQLERWYSIEVVYEAKVPDIQFKGDMDRGVSLSDIIGLFKDWGLKARIEGRKLIIE